MSEQDENQVTPEVPEQNGAENKAPEETKELSFEQELSEARKGDEPETPVEEGAKPEEDPEQKPADGEKPENSEEEKPQETEAERKQRFYEMRQAQKQQKQLVEKSIDQNYQAPQPDSLVQQFIDQGYTQFEAEMKAENEYRNQREQLREARTQVAELNMQINTEAVQVMHDFPVYDPNSPEYDKDFAARASAMYERAAGVQTDPKTGVIVATNLTPYNFYKELAEMRNSGMSQAQIKAQKAAEAQMASVAPPVSSAPQPTQSDEDKKASSLEAALNAVR